MRACIPLILVLALMQSSSAFEWKTCADGQADVTHVSLSPDPPKAGDTIQFSIDADSSTSAMRDQPKVERLCLQNGSAFNSILCMQKLT